MIMEQRVEITVFQQYQYKLHGDWAYISDLSVVFFVVVLVCRISLLQFKLKIDFKQAFLE